MVNNKNMLEALSFTLLSLFLFNLPTSFSGLMLMLLILLSSFTAVLVLHPPDLLSDFFELQRWTVVDESFRIVLVLLPVLHLYISYMIEVIK